jgi:hypothetical protein
MSRELADTVRANTAPVRSFEDNPLSALPDGWAAPVSFFMASKASLVKSPLSLCVSLKYWAAKGLTLDDAKACFRRLCDPDVAATHQFESQLMADLAGLVATALRRRRTIAEQMRRREAAAEPSGVAGQVVRLADLFSMPKGG